MKNILMFLVILGLFISCSDTKPFNTVSPTGTIEEIVNTSKGAQVKIKFSYEGEYPYDIYYWFSGSDTCRVGQIVQLK